MSDKGVSVYLQSKFPIKCDDLGNNKDDLHCGDISIGDATRFIEKVAMQKPYNPYCIRSINSVLKTQTYHGCPGNEVKLIIWVLPDDGRCRNVKDGNDRYARQRCVENIASGKCKDSLVIELIGKVFFPQKYKER